ncbi:uncharacterized protein JN550_000057 [Neoarthrinium moseri]|uniref:uncharacterized protein n=1 Tax=Neoarthrinium moseri TaxID=1658444 RepID=UPI001FDEA27F|nr:uncharacterized protein JN550_000057 [Neoarthrinium moseri]KAI1877875.1 hypothetical protein JN550_000057 [Neoarthrinium moseri]
MLTCRACTRRALASLLEAALPAEPRATSLRPPVSWTSSPAPARTYATTATTATTAAPANESSFRDLDLKDGRPKVPGKKPKRTVSKSTEWAVNKQLEYIDDPYHIAKEVERTLARDRLEEATLLVHKASKTAQVPVSWNHLIDYQMRKHRLHAAIKLYNDMKKRGQLPTAQTYTVIFRGCAASPHSKLAVSEAQRIYNNMIASERITPNVVHMNAVLHVCARAQDFDTMFTVLKTADNKLRSPNNLTFTTVLNALRASVSGSKDRDATEKDVAQAKTQTVQRAKTIWDDVMAKWRSASMFVDEELVCAMGRILLLGSYHDNNDIFSLIEQTMNIPKEPEQLSSLAWKGVKDDSPSAPPPEGDSTPSTKAVSRIDARPSGSSKAFARPGKNSLSLVMTAIHNTGKANLARRYWIIFTKNHGVVPDAENWRALFRALCRGKSSTKAVEYLSEVPKQMTTPSIFQYAMTTCLRDNLNRSAFNNATGILEIMLTSLRIPDLYVLRTYLRVAYANKRFFEETAQKDPEKAKLMWGRQMCTALENLWEPYQIVAKQFSLRKLDSLADRNVVDDADRVAWEKEKAQIADLAALARKMIAAHDRIIFDNMAPVDVAKRIAPRRNLLNRFVVRYFEDRAKFEPSFNRKTEEDSMALETESFSS